MITDYEDDAHFCLKCHHTIIGLENYVSHRKAGCSRTNEGPPKSPLPSQLLPPDESFNLKADDFFSSLELRSSSKKQETHSTSGKNFSGILTRSKTTAAIQATTAKDLTEPQQSKSGKNVWIGGHQLKELGYGDNQSKLIKAVDNLERRKEEPTRIQVYDESDEGSEEYEYDDEDSSSDDRDSPLRQHTGGKWKPTSPIQWSKSESRDWSVPPPTHTGGKWKPNSKRPLSPSLCYIKSTKWKQDSTSQEDESIPPPTFTGSKWVAPKKQDFSDIPPPSHTKGKWKPRVDEDDDVPPPNYTKGKWKPRGQNEDDVTSPTSTKGKWKPKCEQKLLLPSCTKTKLKLATNKPRLKLKTKEDDYPPPNHTKGKWKPKETPDDVPPPNHTKGKWKPRIPNEDTLEPKPTKPKTGLVSSKKSQLLKQTTNETHYGKEKWLLAEPSSSKDDNSFLRKSNGTIQYWCSPCNRRLASKIVYERHLNSELHFKRTLHDREFDDGEEIIFRKEVGSAKIKPPETIFSDQGNTSGDTLKKRNRKKVYIRCGVCHSKVNKHLIGKHLISHYHCRKGDITTPLATKMVLDNIHQIVLETPFQCSICKFYCNTHENFLRHWLSDYHTQRKSPGYFFCMLCKYKSEDSDLMYEHLISEEHSEVVSVINRSVPIVIKKVNPIRCQTCDKEFMLNIQLIKHCERFNHDLLQTKKVKMEHVCGKCGVGFLSSISLARHERTIHDMNYYMCGKCDLKFDSKSSALAHRRTAKHKYRLGGELERKSLKKKCMHCGECFNNFLLLKEHLNLKHPEQKVRCPECGATFTISQELTTHIRLKQCKFEATPETSTNDFRCDKCPFSSDNYSELLFHITLHQEPLQVSPDPKSKSKPSLRYKCTMCDKFFPRSSLLGHIRQHTNEKPFECTVCGKSFARKNNLQYHMNNHTETKVVKKTSLKLSLKKPYLCSTCGSSFKTRWLLQQHMFVHTGKICKCPKFGCLYTARKQSEIHIHYKTHFDTREFECNLCDYKGKTKQHLNRHNLVHTKEKKYQCPFCSFSGRNSTDVKRHCRVHTGAKPFHCPHCDYKCNNLENLRKHILSTNKHPGKSIYECKFCDFRDNFAKNFKNHLILEHSDTFRNSKEASTFIAGIYDYQFDNTISELQIVNQEEQDEEHSYHREEPDENNLRLKTKDDPVVCQVFNQPSTSKEPQMDQLLPMFVIPKDDSWNLVRRYDVEEDTGTLVSFHSDNESLFEEHY